MIYRELKYWIAQSESFQSFKDFKLPTEIMADYPFFKRPDEFYISLIGQLFDVLRGEMTDEKRSDIISIAKGLEVFALTGKRENFKGLDYNFNLLLVASLYSITDFPSSAALIVNHLDPLSFNEEVEDFLLLVLKKKYNKDYAERNRLYQLLFSFLQTGNPSYFRDINNVLEKFSKEGERNNPKQFVITEITKHVLEKFIINNLWYDLLEYNTVDYWKEFILLNYAKKYSVWNFFPSQRAAIHQGLLEIKNSMALQMPTSSGKTTIAELAIFNELKSNPEGKVLYLAPYRALASELKLSLGKNLARLNILTKTIYGGNYPTLLERTSLDEADLVISTPEKFMAFEDFDTTLTSKFSLVICDEGHLIDDSSRGLSYELLLSRMKRTPSLKFLFISAIIPNIDTINAWLGGDKKDVIRSNYRPTEIQYAILRPSEYSEDEYILEVNPTKKVPENYKINKFIQKSDLEYISKKGRTSVLNIASKKRLKSVIAALKVMPSGSVALFAPEKSKTTGVYGLAKELVEVLSTNNRLPVCTQTADMTYLQDLKNYLDIVFGESYLLNLACENGFLFHHGDIPQFVRELIEDAIRTEKIKLIICTNTLAEGVNLPIRNVVIHSTQRFNYALRRKEPIRNRDLKNLIGRAGRAGKETKGLVIIPHPEDFEIIKPIITDEGAEDVKGYLYYTVATINRYLKVKRLQLSNELINDLNEVDSIDTAIIDLLAEEADPADLKSYIENLAKETLTYYQADDEIKSGLQNLFSVRGDKLNGFIESGDYKFIKNSGINIRNYESIYNSIDFDNDEYWFHNGDADDEDILTFLIDACYQLTSIKGVVLDEDEEIDEYYNKEKVKSIIKLWLNGAWYEEIGALFDEDTIDILPFMNGFICYEFQNSCANIIRVAQLKRESNEKEVSDTILDWPNLLLYGIKSKLQLNLVDLGFVDRVLIWKLSEILENFEWQPVDTRSLKSMLLDNRGILLAELESALPKISYQKAVESFYDLDYRMI